MKSETKSKLEDADLYDREYFDAHYVYDPLREEMYDQEYRRFMQMKPSFPDAFEGRVLDVGCGVGSFLERFKEHGWRCYGVEPSKYAREQCENKEIIVFEDFSRFKDNSFDIVIFRGTLQHIARPIQALDEATRVLKVGGELVILATPNSEGLVYKIWRNLPALDAPRNWIIFGEGELRNILHRLGYVNLRSVFPYWGTPYAHPVRDLFKFVVSLFFGYRKFAFPKSMMEIYAIKGDIK
jgi:ubiquinone/menaquinone biosynthesis C-methylase UbiE